MKTSKPEDEGGIGDGINTEKFEVEIKMGILKVIWSKVSAQMRTLGHDTSIDFVIMLCLAARIFGREFVEGVPSRDLGNKQGIIADDDSHFCQGCITTYSLSQLLV